MHLVVTTLSFMVPTLNVTMSSKCCLVPNLVIFLFVYIAFDYTALLLYNEMYAVCKPEYLESYKNAILIKSVLGKLKQSKKKSAFFFVSV